MQIFWEIAARILCGGCIPRKMFPNNLKGKSLGVRREICLLPHRLEAVTKVHRPSMAIFAAAGGKVVSVIGSFTLPHPSKSWSAQTGLLKVSNRTLSSPPSKLQERWNAEGKPIGCLRKVGSGE